MINHAGNYSMQPATLRASIRRRRYQKQLLVIVNSRSRLNAYDIGSISNLLCLVFLVVGVRRELGGCCVVENQCCKKERLNYNIQGDYIRAQKVAAVKTTKLRYSIFRYRSSKIGDNKNNIFIRDHPSHRTTVRAGIPVRASSWFCFSYSGRRTMILRIILPHTRMIISLER